VSLPIFVFVFSVTVMSGIALPADVVTTLKNPPSAVPSEYSPYYSALLTLSDRFLIASQTDIDIFAADVRDSRYDDLKKHVEAFYNIRTSIAYMHEKISLLTLQVRATPQKKDGGITTPPPRHSKGFFERPENTTPRSLLFVGPQSATSPPIAPTISPNVSAEKKASCGPGIYHVLRDHARRATDFVAGKVTSGGVFLASTYVSLRKKMSKLKKNPMSVKTRDYVKAASFVFLVLSVALLAFFFGEWLYNLLPSRLDLPTIRLWVPQPRWVNNSLPSYSSVPVTLGSALPVPCNSDASFHSLSDQVLRLKRRLTQSDNRVQNLERRFGILETQLTHLRPSCSHLTQCISMLQMSSPPINSVINITSPSTSLRVIQTSSSSSRPAKSSPRQRAQCSLDEFANLNRSHHALLVDSWSYTNRLAIVETSLAVIQSTPAPAPCDCKKDQAQIVAQMTSVLDGMRQRMQAIEKIQSQRMEAVEKIQSQQAQELQWMQTLNTAACFTTAAMTVVTVVAVTNPALLTAGWWYGTLTSLVMKPLSIVLAGARLVGSNLGITTFTVFSVANSAE
jgi:hypothetical protein